MPRRRFERLPRGRRQLSGMRFFLWVICWAKLGLPSRARCCSAAATSSSTVGVFVACPRGTSVTGSSASAAAAGSVSSTAAASLAASSLASLAAAVFAPFFYLLGDGTAWSTDKWIAAAIMLISALLIYRHRENIDKLLAGTESRLGGSKPVARR